MHGSAVVRRITMTTGLRVFLQSLRHRRFAGPIENHATRPSIFVIGQENDDSLLEVGVTKILIRDQNPAGREAVGAYLGGNGKRQHKDQKRDQAKHRATIRIAHENLLLFFHLSRPCGLRRRDDFLRLQPWDEIVVVEFHTKRCAALSH